MVRGAPRCSITRSSVSVTDCEGRLFATFNAKHSRVMLPMIVSTRILRPSDNKYGKARSWKVHRR